MFDLSWGEMALVGVVALVVLGPKELPNALRTITNLTKTARKLAGEFQSGVNEIIREADLDEARKKLQEVQSLNKNQIKNVIEQIRSSAMDVTLVAATLLARNDQSNGMRRPSLEHYRPRIRKAGALLTLETHQIERATRNGPPAAL